MPKAHHDHPHPAHGHPSHHRGPAGLHQVGARLREMKALGASQDDLDAVLQELRESLPDELVAQMVALEPIDAADVLSTAAARGNDLALQLMQSEGYSLVAGQMRPHVIEHLLESGLKIVQLHDEAPHGGPPPHFRHLNGYRNFKGVLTLSDATAYNIGVIAVEAFLNGADAFVSPTAVIAARFWSEAQIIAVTSDHRAPHHKVRLQRLVNGLLFWE